MKRLLLVLSLAAIMVAVVAASALPAFAAKPTQFVEFPGGPCDGDGGCGWCGDTYRDLLDPDSSLCGPK